MRVHEKKITRIFKRRTWMKHWSFSDLTESSLSSVIPELSYLLIFSKIVENFPIYSIISPKFFQNPGKFSEIKNVYWRVIDKLYIMYECKPSLIPKDLVMFPLSRVNGTQVFVRWVTWFSGGWWRTTTRWREKRLQEPPSKTDRWASKK